MSRPNVERGAVTGLAIKDVAARTGIAAGTIRMTPSPVSVTFGGPDNAVLYIVGGSSVWSIRTRVHGFRHPSGLN